MSLLVSCASSALAHDTWFERLPSAKPSTLRLALGTGDRFPAQEFTLTSAQLRHSGCRQGASATLPLRRERDTARALILRTASAPQAGAGALSCWAESVPFDIELQPDKVSLYLREIQASPVVWAAWQEMQARGVRWKERYTKHARIELPDAKGSSNSEVSTGLPAQPSGMGLEALLQGPSQTPHLGDALVFQLLRDGAPLANLAVELRSALSPLGIWKRSDAEGRVAFQPPLAGRWLLRGTDLRLSDTLPDTWESRFVTLAFDVAPVRAEAGSGASALRTAAP